VARTQKIKIINILLSSVDGRIATHEQESSADRRLSQFTNKDDFTHLQKLTATCDAVFIGAKSMQSEEGAFRVAHLRKDKTEPHWYVMTKTGHINFEHPFWSQKSIPKSVFKFTPEEESLTTTQLQTKSDIHIMSQNIDYHTGSITSFLDYLKTKKVKKIALLGGGELNGVFWAAGLVSDLYLTMSPMIVGKKTSPQLINFPKTIDTHLKLLKVQKKENFLFLHYTVKKNNRR